MIEVKKLIAASKVVQERLEAFEVADDEARAVQQAADSKRAAADTRRVEAMSAIDDLRALLAAAGAPEISTSQIEKRLSENI